MSVPQWLSTARRVTVLTGAGISTDSGIPDYRGPQGVWTRDPDAEKLVTLSYYVADPDIRRRAWLMRRDTAPDARPNAGHRALVDLERQGRLRALLTQNIDGLHQASGVPERQVIELHGNSTYAHCLDCGERYEIDELRAAFERDGEVHDCRACGGLIKTATISFGQSMPEAAMLRAEREILACDLCLVLGSSLVVYPAAGFPEAAKRNGARLAIVNNEPTGLDPIADLVVHRGIGDVMGGAVGVN